MSYTDKYGHLSYQTMLADLRQWSLDAPWSAGPALRRPPYSCHGETATTLA
ncbi:hypothetical protein SAMCFNEI73_pC1641 (plasmid) [Sinorhizobium americanum]|uniref:Uncharacterized protein n=1 Tax=Sinorhizobium americanum TaxID=194963 RepID=A0A1L3LZ19_9HYPH|nr:hypothetical protein SAMCFNEI73_pC1641 [Sinorhizobium americanum]